MCRLGLISIELSDSDSIRSRVILKLSDDPLHVTLCIHSKSYSSGVLMMCFTVTAILIVTADRLMGTDDIHNGY